QRVHGSAAVVRNRRRPDKAGQFEPAVAVRRAHHRNLDTLVAEARDPSRPFAFDRAPPLELEPELLKEADRRVEVLNHDADVVHPFECHVQAWHGSRATGGKSLTVVSPSATRSRPAAEDPM